MQIKTCARRIPAVIKRDIPTAPLPINYQAAKAALAECACIDECKDWSDKAVAIASYAKQVRDKTMMHNAQRIVLRARERLGELLLEWTAENNSGSKSKHAIADQLGVDHALADQAIAIARVPKKVRDSEIEGAPPIAPTRLAALTPRVYARYSAPPPSEADYIIDYIDSLHGIIAEVGSAVAAARKIDLADLTYVRRKVIAVQEWLDAFEQALPKT